MKRKSENLVGRGTFGSIFKHVDETTGEVLAIKQFVVCQSGEISFDYIREVSILKKCNHQNVIKLLSFELPDNITIPYYEYTLYEYAYNRDTKLESKICKIITYKILRGVHYLHSNGIVHRDIKPSNIMINSKTKDVILIDYGLSRCNVKTNGRHTPNDVCTIYYRPPEILLGYETHDYKVDIWSVGCILAELNLGRHFINKPDPYSQIIKQFKLFGTPNEETWPNITSLKSYMTFPIYKGKCNKFTGLLNDLIMNMLKMYPDDRYNCCKSLQHGYFKDILPEMKCYESLKIKDCQYNILDNGINYKCNLSYESWSHSELKLFMRRILVSWINDVNREYRLKDSTYFITIGLLDRMLIDHSQHINIVNMQLLGITCIYIATKLEEIKPISKKNLIYISENSYTKEQLICMERTILNCLNFDIIFPTPYIFLDICTSKNNLSQEEQKEALMNLYVLSLYDELTDYQPFMLCWIVCVIISNRSTNKECEKEYIEVIHILEHFKDSDLYRDMKNYYKNEDWYQRYYMD